MKLLAAFVAVSFQIAHARRLQIADTVPTYTPEECDVWLAGGSAFDADASGGLSSDEYFAVLSSLGLTTVATSYSDLAFDDKMVFSSLACSCVSLGMGEDCCSGDDAEIPLSVLTTVGDPAVDAYKADLCNLLASVIFEETTAPVPAPGATLSPVAAGVTEPPGVASEPIIFNIPGVVADFDAAEISANEGSNDILGHIIQGFQTVSNEILTAESVRKVRGLRASKRALQSLTMDPVEVTDIACPAGLAYAEEGATCVNFKFTVLTEDLGAETATSYSEEMSAKIADGTLYDTVKTDYPDTFILGLGSPGKGTTDGTTDSTAAPEETVTVPPVVDPIVTEEPVVAEPESTGLSAIAIVFIVLAVILLPVAIVAGYAKYRKGQDAERIEYVRQLEASRASKGGDDFYDPAEVNRSTAGSSLAAMGAAGAIVYAKVPSDPAELEQEIRILVEETKSPKSADELLKAYAGREADLLKNLRKMKALQDKNDAIRAEVADLCDKVNSPKSPDELLSSYKGREDELLKNLRRLSFKQQSVEEKKAMRAEVVALVEELQIPKSPDDLLSTYEGREKELLKNLNKMKAKKAEEVATIAAIKVLVDELAVPRSADEMLETYKGREGVLLTNLKKMSTKKLRDSEIKAEIEDLVAELDAPKSADEMLASYQGREEVLLANLRKLKSKKDLSASQLAKKEATIAEIRIICDQLTLPKTADDMISGYEGREEELLKNLQKMKAKNDMAAELKASKADTIAEVTSLCGELKLPKNADEMLASYEGREEELLKNLQKMKSKQESAAALKASKAATIAEVTSLCDELKPGKSSEELLAAYEGREQELVTHLKKLQTSKRNA